MVGTHTNAQGTGGTASTSDNRRRLVLDARVALSVRANSIGIQANAVEAWVTILLTTWQVRWSRLEGKSGNEAGVRNPAHVFGVKAISGEEQSKGDLPVLLIAAAEGRRPGPELHIVQSRPRAGCLERPSLRRAARGELLPRTLVTLLQYGAGGSARDNFRRQGARRTNCGGHSRTGTVHSQPAQEAESDLRHPDRSSPKDSRAVLNADYTVRSDPYETLKALRALSG